MVKECVSCSMRLPGGYTINKEYLCRGCYERLSSKEARDNWYFKIGNVVEIVTRNKIRTRKP